MAGTFSMVDVKCPFYCYDDMKAKKIVCEGVGESETVSLFYREKQEFQKQLDVFCCENYEKCEIYRAVMEKYDED